MDLAQSLTSQYSQDWKSQIGHFNLLMAFTNAMLQHKVTTKMTFTFVHKGHYAVEWLTISHNRLQLHVPHYLIMKEKKVHKQLYSLGCNNIRLFNVLLHYA